ncbi:SAM-dependent methyltransferase [Flavitalea sp. BT771]|uniref:class I SAM-dependent methyltransferase n=1 Tax=Flavitalea sp. BT771 TaxID=3063329 RepID=UPI0026E24F79|nr:SAM-dependent methyltransferase [Flavitalea sp. BT771]MDO6429132.1 SAM-dependent methyltransferase [Flavitalea sp. BT771]MDV6218740.1 SAM-dependent methyltransferase [Flavitalea sp. BT771]
MKANTPSKTAQYMALYRAMETRRPKNRRLFTDPYAIHFLDFSLRLACRAAVFPPAEHLLYRCIQRRIPGALASGLARTCLIDEWLETTVSRGIQQLIILGAGFDTRSLRLDYLRALPVIEIDHPDTARRKLQVLEHHAPTLPGNTRYLSIDFDRQSLEDLFRQQHVDLSVPTTLIWEGVTNYLRKEAVDAVFGLAAQLPKGSFIIFTYVDRKVLEDPAAFFGAERLLNDLAAIEERWTFGFRPEELPTYLAGFGMRLIKDTGAADYRQRYLPERKKILKGYEFYRVAMAGIS